MRGDKLLAHLLARRDYAPGTSCHEGRSSPRSCAILCADARGSPAERAHEAFVVAHRHRRRWPGMRGRAFRAGREVGDGALDRVWRGAGGLRGWAAGRGAPRLSARGGGHHPARRSLVTDQRDRGRRGARAVRHHRLRLPDCCGVTWWAVVRTMVAFGYAVVEARRTLMDRASGDTCVVWGERGRTPSQHPAGGKP